MACLQRLCGGHQMIENVPCWQLANIDGGSYERIGCDLAFFCMVTCPGDGGRASVGR